MLRCPWNLCLRRLSFLPPLATGPPSNCDQISSHIRPGTAATYLDARAAPAPSACQAASPAGGGTSMGGRDRPPLAQPIHQTAARKFLRGSHKHLLSFRRFAGQRVGCSVRPSCTHSATLWMREVALPTGCYLDTCAAGSIQPG